MARILWVDDNPNNNLDERQALRQEYSVDFDLAETTEEALKKLRSGSYDGVISDQKRGTDETAGYDLHDAMKDHDLDDIPFILYAGQAKPHHIREAERRSMYGTTNEPGELRRMVGEILSPSGSSDAKRSDLSDIEDEDADSSPTGAETKTESHPKSISSRSASSDPQVSERYVLDENQFFLEGDGVQSRMKDVRDAIVAVRKNWEGDPYAFLKAQLEELPDEHVKEYPGLVEYARSIVNEKRHRDWVTPLPGDEDSKGAVDVDVVRDYTHRQRYGDVFKKMNEIRRRYKYEEAPSLHNIATMVLEYVNVDLFRYATNMRPGTDAVEAAKTILPGFEGIVYRGVNMQAGYVDTLKSMSAEDLVDLRLGIPLTLQSASTNIRKAARFLRDSRRRDDAKGLRPVILKVHVHGLQTVHLGEYWERYPRSVVSSICAVPIEDVSDYPDEEEVLLRGPFFDALSFRENAYPEWLSTEFESPVAELEVATLNANRDHLSSYHLRDEGKHDEARTLFGRIIQLRKNEFFRDYFARHGQDDVAHRFDAKVTRQSTGYLHETGSAWPEKPVTNLEAKKS